MLIDHDRAEPMSVRGSLVTMPGEDVLEWASHRRIAGVATFEQRGTIRSLGVADGQIQWASSNRSDEQLGAVLLRSGHVGEHALAEALEARSETGVPLGKVLQMAGSVSEDTLVDTLATKIREAVTDILTWTDGTFDVVLRSQPPSAGVGASIAIDIALTVARRRSQRLTQAIGQIGGDDDVTFYVPPSTAAQPSAPSDIAIDASRLWMLLQTGLSIGQLAASLGGERFGVMTTIASWIESGALVVDRRRRTRTDTALELASGARGRLKEGDRAGALTLAAQAMQQDPGDPEVRRMYAAVERARVAEIARSLLARHSIPRRAKTAANLDGLPLTQLERELAERVDGRWDLLTLVRSASAREAEALLAFARLTELGVVELG
jgi:hypothetical protein